jgi:hypothetical protein
MTQVSRTIMGQRPSETDRRGHGNQLELVINIYLTGRVSKISLDFKLCLLYKKIFQKPGIETFNYLEVGDRWSVANLNWFS